MKINNITIFSIVLVVVFVGALFLFPSAKSKPTPQVISPEIKKQLVELMEQKEEVKTPIHQQWDTRNPFVPAIGHGGTDNNGIKLVGIFVGSDKPSAIINNKIYAVGGKIEDMRVIAIKNDSVVLADPLGGQMVFSIKESFTFKDLNSSTPKEDAKSAQVDSKDLKQKPLPKRAPARPHPKPLAQAVPDEEPVPEK